MAMTTKQIQDLAKQVSTLYNVSLYKTLAEEEPFYDDECNFRGYQKKRLYLEKDLDAVMRLAIENNISISFELHPMGNNIVTRGINKGWKVTEGYDQQRSTDKLRATIVAVMRALVELKR